MKKLILVATILVFMSGCATTRDTLQEKAERGATNAYIGSLTGDTTPTQDDLIETENSPASSPNSRAVTLGNAIKKAHGLSDGMVKVASGTMAPALSTADYQAYMAAASKVEMEAGTEAGLRSMSPLRVAEAVAALGGTGTGIGGWDPTVRTAAPTSPVSGWVYRADNEAAGWDPIGYAGTDDYFVLYTGSAYIGIMDINGNLLMATNEVIGSTAINLTVEQMSNGIISNYGQGAADVALTLPTAAAGLSGLFEVITAQSNKWGVRAGATDLIYLLAADGTIAVGSDNGYARMTAAQAGQSFACWAFKSGASTYDWKCKAIAVGTSTFAAN